MSDIHIRTDGGAGRITLTRPKALNAMTYEMCLAIEGAIDRWRDDDAVKLIIIDAEGDKAFCAGGDIQEMYRTGTAGNYDYGRGFWRDEYRLNAKIAEYPKPYIAFMQGFTMGGGVGISCHGSHRIVCETSQIAMPECSIGLVPDVGGSLLLARAPGRLGEYLGVTAARMGPQDAIFAGFADAYVPRGAWPDLIGALSETCDLASIAAACDAPPAGSFSGLLPLIDAHFSGEALLDVLNALRSNSNDFTSDTLKLMARNAPLSMASTIEMIHRLRGPTADIRRALELEYRFTYRAMEYGDFLEGIRAQVIDKDRNPNWRLDVDAPLALAATKMLMPLGAHKLSLDKKG